MVLLKKPAIVAMAPFCLHRLQLQLHQLFCMVKSEQALLFAVAILTPDESMARLVLLLAQSAHAL